ncbi:glycosyltransferase family 4 protein [Zobellella denitrificans]|uniref:glycosyltransferase family 4 protein n=1 Tax=Zobellella denitrificans TaxID=347534 RepID=UPI00115CCACC|nr:glycosyltransferase family 4 protein [Zobellella denitrificans]
MAFWEQQKPVRVLLVSYYFPPDLCAGSFRAEALARSLVTTSGKNVQLDVVTTSPNRYQSHRPVISDDGDYPYSVNRVPLPNTIDGLVGQVRGFSYFSMNVHKHIPGEQYDIVVATSSRLMTAYLGAKPG